MTQTIAIIGAGPGISRAVAHQFGRKRYWVVLIGRTESTLIDLVNELRQAGVSSTAVIADASDAGQLTTALQSINGLSVLHYSAGAGPQRHLRGRVAGERVCQRNRPDI
ncbi:MAG: SDR family NAD(P)-dependent oxidoreductase [Bacteroidetes bacterium]|nr:SDR family NAD(P)-dependent oxidoreductase [Fibrella sp.]